MPDREKMQLQIYSQLVFEPADDIVELRLIKAGEKPVQRWVTAKELPGQTEMLERYNQNDFNIYAGTNPRKAPGLSGDEHVKLARSIFADFDHIENGDLEPSEFILKKIKEAKLPKPTMLIDSGHGIHVYWLLEEPLVDLSQWKLIQQRLIVTLDSDKSIKNPERIMRLPGFWNVKKKPYVECSIISYDAERRYKLDDIVKHLTELPESEPEPIQGQNDTARQDNVKPLEKRVRAILYAAKWPPCNQGERNNIAYNHACQLRDFDLPEMEAFEILADWNIGNCPPLAEAEIHKAITNANNYAKKPAGTKLNEPLKLKTQTNSEWPELIRLWNRQLPVFPIEALPDDLRGYVCEIAKSLQVPVDLPAMLGFAAISVVVGGKFEVVPKPDWIEPSNLYICVVMPSATRKSAVFKLLVEPIKVYEAKLLEKLKPDIEKNRSEFAILEAKKKRLQNDIAREKASRSDLNEVIEQISDFHQLYEPTLIASDVTVEVVSRLLFENDGRLAIMGTEGGIFAIFAGRYSDNSPCNDVFLNAHAGDPIKVNRIGRSSEYIPKPALTMGICIQPTILENMGHKRLLQDSGLLGRFLFSMPDVEMGAETFDTPTISQTAKIKYENLINLLLDYSELIKETQTLTFDTEAQKIFARFYENIAKRLSETGDLNSISSWGGKLRGAVARIAGIIELANSCTAETISRGSIEAAIKIGHYLIDHAKTAFRQIDLDRTCYTALKIIKWLEAEKQKDFSKRDLFEHIKGQSDINKVDDLEAPLGLLIEHGYIRQKANNENKKGRPSQIYEVNPEL